MRLIISGDDFGLTPEHSREILQSFHKGVLTSTSVMINRALGDPWLPHLTGLKLGIGIHLNLLSGTPLSPAKEIPSLVNQQGNFHSPMVFFLNYYLGRIRLQEVEKEFLAQVEFFKSTGLRPTHLDTHYHIHLLPGIFKVLLETGRKTGINTFRNSFRTSTFPIFPKQVPRDIVKSYLILQGKLRGLARNMKKTEHWNMPDLVIGVYYPDQRNLMNVLTLLAETDLTVELIVHPENRPDGNWNHFLRGDSFSAFLEEYAIERIHFGQLNN